ncbi:hypothetical protein N431DRAFT_456726 [Stipitochalara longipes BDJ]|nr:hypothetical protein N431DRAFT_456726 [Stipitochalara longipes BDJ]
MATAKQQEGEVKMKALNEYFQVVRTAEDVGPPMVKIYVGPERKLWVLPEQLLCDRNKFFKAAFQSGFRESKEKMLELPGDDPTALAYILDRILGVPWDEEYNFGGNHEDGQLILCKIHVLAHKLGCHDHSNAEWSYSNEFRREIHECLSTGKELPLVSPAAAKYLYENTGDDSSMRQMLAGFLATIQLINPPVGDSQMENWVLRAASHPRFHFDVMAFMRDHIKLSAKDCELDCCAIHPDLYAA